MIRKIFKSKNLNLRNQKSFSLIELLVAMGILVLIILTATAISISVIRSQRANRAFQEVQDNGRYIMEMMVKEIRMSKIIIQGTELATIPGTVLGIYQPCLVIDTGSANENTEYCPADNSLHKEIINTGYNTVTDDLQLNSDNVKVTNLKFYISNIPEIYKETNYYRRVTIAMSLESAENSNISLDLQTTICSRPPLCPSGVCSKIFSSPNP